MKNEEHPVEKNRKLNKTEQVKAKTKAVLFICSLSGLPLKLK